MAVVLAAGSYVHWGVLNVSVTNIAIIALMILVFALAILVPFPHGADEPDIAPRDEEQRS